MNMSWLSVLGIILCVLTFIGTILIFVDKESNFGNIVTCILSGLLMIFLTYDMLKSDSVIRPAAQSAIQHGSNVAQTVGSAVGSAANTATTQLRV